MWVEYFRRGKIKYIGKASFTSHAALRKKIALGKLRLESVASDYD
jgi:hypothetical protein